MQPFWTTHTPLEIALNALGDAIWVFTYVIAFVYVTARYFTTQDTTQVTTVETPEALPTPVTPAKVKRNRKPKVVAA
jgi:hypothetical protein